MKVIGKEYFIHEFELCGNLQRVCLEQRFDDVNDLLDYIKCNIVSVACEKDGVVKFFLDGNVIVCNSCGIMEIFKNEGLDVFLDVLFEEYRKTLGKE